MDGKESWKKEEKDISSQLINSLPKEETNLLLLNNMHVKNFNLRRSEEVLFGRIKT